MKRIMSVVIALAIVISAIPITAFANQESDDSTQVSALDYQDAAPLSADAWDGTIASGFARGDGSAQFPYIIETASQLAFLAQSVNDGNSYENKYIDLASDIDLGQREWTPIGEGLIGYINNKYVYKTFKGFFNGNGYSISGLKITKINTSLEESYQGLFGYNEGSICDLNIIDAQLSFNSSNRCIYAGALTAVNRGVINNCDVSGTVLGSYLDVGTLCGYNANTIVQCTAHTVMKITYESSNVGGLVGLNLATINLCNSSGSITVESEVSSVVGGLIGCAYQGEVTNSYSTVSVSSEGSFQSSIVGGLIGENYAVVSNCFANGEVFCKTQGSPIAGGLIGYNRSSDVKNCYAGNSSVSALFIPKQQIDSMAGRLIGGASIDCLYNNCYYNSDMTVERTEYIEEKTEGSGCNKVTTPAHNETQKSPSNDLGGKFTYGSQYPRVVVGWGTYSPDNVSSDPWIGNGNDPTLYFEKNVHLTVRYICNGEVFNVSYADVFPGQQVSITSPELEGYISSYDVVTKTLYDDTTVDVVYERITHKVNISCFDTSGTLRANHTVTIPENSSYSFDAPYVKGYTPQTATVSGYMGYEDIDIDLIYDVNEYSFTIQYQYDDGTEAAPALVGTRKFGESLTVESPIISGKKLAVDTDSVVVIPRDAETFEYIVRYVDSDKLAYTITTMLNTAEGPRTLSGVQVTFNGETKSTDVNGRATFVYEPGTETVTLKIRKDGYYSILYENDTEYKLKSDIGVDYFNMIYDTVDNPLYFVQGVSCYGNDIEKDYGVINVKYNGYIPIVVKGNVPQTDRIIKMELVQEVEAKDVNGKVIEGIVSRKILKTINSGSAKLSADGLGLFEMLGSQFTHSPYKKYPIYVYMYTEYGNEPVIQELKISTISFTADFKFDGLFDDAEFTLDDTGLSFLDGSKLSLKMNEDYQTGFPFEFEIRNNEVYAGYNMGEDFYSEITGIDSSLLNAFKDGTEKRVQKWMKGMGEKVDKKLNKIKGVSAKTHTSFQIDADAFGGLCFTINENQNVDVQAYIKVCLSFKSSWTTDFLVVFIPITVTVKVDVNGGITIDGLGFDFERKELFVHEVSIDINVPIEASIGLGNRFASAGFFGKITLETTIVIGETTYWDFLVLSVRAGCYAKLDLGLLTLRGETAWDFRKVLITSRNSINTASSPPLNSDGYIGEYNGLPVYDISSYSLEEQAEILDIPSWSIEGATELEAPESNSETDRLITIDAAKERIVKINNQKVSVYFANDTESVAANAKVLVYSVYDESTETWTEPQIVSDNGTGDTSFDIINHNGKVYIVFGESNIAFDYSMYVDDATLINDMTFSQEIRVAVYDPSTKSFNIVKEMTSDNYYDTMPTFGVVNGELYLAWVKNTAHDDTTTFCMNTDNYIYYSSLVGESWTDPVIAVNNCFPVVDMTVVELSDQPCVALIVDEDVSLYSDDDRNIYISDLNGNLSYINCYGAIVSQLQAVNNSASTYLLWKSGNEIMTLRTIDGTPTSFSGSDNSIGEDFIFVKVNDTTDAILWAVKDVGSDNSDESTTSEISASYSYMGGEWTKPSVLMSVPYHLMSFDVLVYDDIFEIVFTNTNVVTDKDGGTEQALNSYSRVFYKSVELPTIASISDKNVVIDRDNNKVNISFVVFNDGAYKFDKIEATLIDVVRKEITGSGGRPGGSGGTIRSAPITQSSVDNIQYTIVHNEYELGQFSCELMPGESRTITVVIEWDDAMILDDYFIRAILGSSNEFGNVTIIGGSPSSSEGTFVEFLHPDIAVSGEYIIIGETEYVSMRVENIGKSVATINNLELYRTNDDGTFEKKPFYEQSFESLMPNQVVYYLLKLEKDFFEETAETFKCMVSCPNDQDFTNNSTIVVARKLEGAEGTQRDLLVEVPVLDSYQQTFDKYLPYSSDINIDITMTDDLLMYAGCVDENQSTVTPYSIEDGKDQHFIFYQNYLSTWETGWHEFSFIYLTQAGYIDILYTINVIDSTPIPLTGSIYITLDSDETPVSDTVNRGDKLTVDISSLNAELITFEWVINGEVVSTEKDYVIDDKYLGNNIQAKVKGVAPYYGEALSQVLWIDKVHRQLTAPVISSASEDNVVVLQKSFHVGDDELYYGFSQINDGNTVSNWQTSNQLAIPNDGVYYLFTMAPGSSIYSKTISSGTLYSTLPGIIVNDVSNVGYTLEGRVVTVQYYTACRIVYLQEDVFNIITSSLSDNGMYSFVVPETVNEVILFVLGDIDCNGKVEESDVTNLKNFILDKGGTISEYGIFAGDIDANGRITALDLALINAASKDKIFLSW